MRCPNVDGHDIPDELIDEAIEELAECLREGGEPVCDASYIGMIRLGIWSLMETWSEQGLDLKELRERILSELDEAEKDRRRRVN